MIKLVIILISPFSFLFGQTNPILKTDTLSDLYKKSIISKDSLIYQSKFFHSFPATFRDFNDTYGYFDNQDPHLTYAGALYPDSYKHIELLFRLTNIPEREYYNKIINIAIGGHWEADAINYFQNGLRNKVFENPRLTIDLLKIKSDRDILSFWFFFYSSIHPVYDHIPNKLTALKTYDNKIYGLMQKGLDKALKESGH